MKNIRVVFAMLLTVFCFKAQAGELQSEPDSAQWIVAVFLPDIEAVPELNNDNWINLADLPFSEQPDSYYQGFKLPNINTVYTWRKSVIDSLATGCTTVFIDYEESTVSGLSELPVDKIVAIGICGSQARIVTTAALSTGSNPACISADLMEFVSLAKSAGAD